MLLFGQYMESRNASEQPFPSLLCPCLQHILLCLLYHIWERSNGNISAPSSKASQLGQLHQHKDHREHGNWNYTHHGKIRSQLHNCWPLLRNWCRLIFFVWANQDRQKAKPMPEGACPAPKIAQEMENDCITAITGMPVADSWHSLLSDLKKVSKCYSLLLLVPPQKNFWKDQTLHKHLWRKLWPATAAFLGKGNLLQP